MSHSPALENCSPAATTPSTPILRGLGSERNPSRSPPHIRDDKFSIYQLGSKEHHLATVAIGMTPELLGQSKDDSKHHKSSEKFVHRSHGNLQVTLPSSVSNMTEAQWHNLQHTPINAPHSPGALSWTGDINEATPSERLSDTGTGGSSGTGLRLSRKESYKAQRQHYRKEKKRVASELLSSLEDPAIIILANWLKVRGSLKSWTKLWCVLKPGLLLLYKSPKTKSSHWVGTVLLTTCHVIERPSKKDGFCFKLYHPLEQSIWATRGPHNETIGAVVQPLPTAHLIFRAPSQTAGKCWLDGLELALKSSNMLLRCGGNSTVKNTTDSTTNHETQWSSEDLEKHFPEQVAKLLDLIDKVSRNEKDNQCFKCHPDDSNNDKINDLEQSIIKWKKILEEFEKGYIETFSLAGCSTKTHENNDSKSTKEKNDTSNLDFQIIPQVNQPSGSKWKITNFNVFSNVLLTKRNQPDLSEDCNSKDNSFLKNTICTASLKSKFLLKEKDNTKRSLTPLRYLKKNVENPREIPIVQKQSESNDNNNTHKTENNDNLVKNTNTTGLFEEQIYRFTRMFPKHRSSTPSIPKVPQKDKCPEEDVVLRNPNKCSDDSFLSENVKKIPIDVKLKSILNNYVSGRKSAEPRIDFANQEKIISFGNLEYQNKLTESVPGISKRFLDNTPEKFSLINYEKLPSVKALERESQLNLERQSSQFVHFTGKVVKEKDLEGGEMSDTDSEGVHDAIDRPNVLQDEDVMADKLRNHINALYINELSDDVGQSGEVVEELAEENKSLLWYLVKQVRPGMDLSKVVLPTFILEPRSFLDKLSDSFYHSDILSSACQKADPYERMKIVVQWYLSGLYRKPRGLKKPYNPVLGETFRCCWLHETSGSRTYYVAEQVSHHPPVSAFYVSNRKEGFAIEASILAKSKFYGNSTSAILEGAAKITLLPLRETYVATSPYAHCKGLLMGTLSMELGGRVVINCPSTSYSAEIEFRLKPFIGGADSINMVSGRIRYHKETLATLEGHWDDKIHLKDRKTQEESILINVSELKNKRLRRQLINPDNLGEFESQRLWSKVSLAIANDDQIAATEEKTLIEEAQRERARGLGGKEWIPRYFGKAVPDDGNPVNSMHVSDTSSNSWQYNYPNFTPWDDRVDVLEYEDNFVLKTFRHKPLSARTKTGSSRPLPQPETEHSGTESDSTNSHHHRMSQGRQSVASALMRVEAELADVMTMVSRMDGEQDSPLRTANFKTQLDGKEPNAATLLMAVLVQQQAVAGGLARVEAVLRERLTPTPPSKILKSYISDYMFLFILLPLNILAYFIYKWLFLD